jgi:dienelactone hydrolase
MMGMNGRWWTFALACILAGPCGAAVTAVDVDLAGRTVRVDVHRPDGTARGAVVLAHGFLRSRGTMAGHADALARSGALVIVPDLPSWTDSRENGRALVELVARVRAGAFGAPVERVMLVGFSAGGLAALLAAASPGVVAYVGLDAFDRPGGVGLEAARTLRTPAFLVRGPSSFCNAYDIAAPWSAVLPALVEERAVAGASHCDFEAPTDRWCTLLCGATDPARQKAVRDALRVAVERYLPAAPAPR